MITDVLHRLAGNPWIYDRIQTLAGSRLVLEHLRTLVARLDTPGVVLDIGGGTGINHVLWPDGVSYICLDLDDQKLHRYLAKRPQGIAVLADATALPFCDASVDVVLCTAVTHHLADAELVRFLEESVRVLRKTGSLILIDAVWDPKRLTGRLLWRYDVGAHARSKESLEKLMTDRFTMGHGETFTVFHRYALWLWNPARV